MLQKKHQKCTPYSRKTEESYPPPPFLLHYWGGVNKLAQSFGISLPPVRFLVSFWDDHLGEEWDSHIYRWWVWIVIGYYVKNTTCTCKRQNWNYRKLHFRLSLTMSGNLTLTFVQELQPHPQALTVVWHHSNLELQHMNNLYCYKDLSFH